MIIIYIYICVYTSIIIIIVSEGQLFLLQPQRNLTWLFMSHDKCYMYGDEFNKGGSHPLLIHPLGIFTSLSHHSSLSQIVTVLICTLAQMYIPWPLPGPVSFSHMVLFLSLGVDCSDYNFHVYAAIDHLWQWITVGYGIVKFYNMPMISNAEFVFKSYHLKCTTIDHVVIEYMEQNRSTWYCSHC